MGLLAFAIYKLFTGTWRLYTYIPGKWVGGINWIARFWPNKTWLLFQAKKTNM